MPIPTMPISKAWTPERIARLSVQDIQRLRANALRLNEAGVALLCDAALDGAPPAPSPRVPRSAGPGTRARRLVARTHAFQARGVWLYDPRTSWGGVRKSDGLVVMALWADAIESADGGCRYLLWAPNVEGSRPWSDQPGGVERLEHCRRALQLGSAEGLLVYGECCAGHLPEDKALTVYGADAETIVHFQVRQRGSQFWAVWGSRRATLAAQ